MTNKLQLVVPEPHSAKQAILFRFNFSVPQTRELWCSIGTKYGKTLACSAGLASFYHLLTYGICRHVAPVYSQSKIGLRYIEKLLPGKPFYKTNNAELAITPMDESRTNRLEFWTGAEPERLEGEAVLRYNFDEYAKMKPECYESAQGTMTRTMGKAAFFSTPRGKNHFYTKCMEAKAEMEWCLKKGLPPSKIFLTARTTDNPYISKTAIEDARRNLPDRLFRQFYLAEFTDSGDVFAYFRRCLFGPELIFENDSQLWIDESILNPQMAIGADWGKMDDYTVFTAFDIVGRRMVGFMKFRFIDYLSAVKNLVWFCSHWEDIVNLRHDKTGIGDVIDDLLYSVDSLVHEGVVFSNKSKSVMVNSLIMAFQRGIPKLPNWPEMVQELDAYSVTVNEIGTFKYASSPGSHDDIVSSMMLSWSIVEEMTDTNLDVISLDQLKDLDLDVIKIGAPDEDFDNWKARD